MKDLTIELGNRPGALAEMGQALGRAGVSIEGGGACVFNGQGVGHFLVADGTSAEQTSASSRNQRACGPRGPGATLGPE